jgi:hypothetical protein
MKAVTFLRDHSLGLRNTSFSLLVPASTLNGWNKEFDSNMHPIIVPDKRGKTSKVTLSMVREIVKIAKHYKTEGNRIRLKEFSRMLAEKKDISLSSKTVGGYPYSQCFEVTENTSEATDILSKTPAGDTQWPCQY